MKRMVVLICILGILVCLITLFPTEFVSAVNESDSEKNNVLLDQELNDKLSIIKKEEIVRAKETLREFGLSENIVNDLPEHELAHYAGAELIHSSVAYVKSDYILKYDPVSGEETIFQTGKEEITENEAFKLVQIENRRVKQLQIERIMRSSASKLAIIPSATGSAQTTVGNTILRVSIFVSKQGSVCNFQTTTEILSSPVAYITDIIATGHNYNMTKVGGSGYSRAAYDKIKIDYKPTGGETYIGQETIATSMVSDCNYGYIYKYNIPTDYPCGPMEFYVARNIRGYLSFRATSLGSGPWGVRALFGHQYRTFNIGVSANIDASGFSLGVSINPESRYHIAQKYISFSG